MKTQCQNLKGNPTQTTGVVRLTPNFVEHIVMLIKHDLHKKKSRFRTFAQLTPSANRVYCQPYTYYLRFGLTVSCFYCLAKHEAMHCILQLAGDRLAAHWWQSCCPTPTSAQPTMYSKHTHTHTHTHTHIHTRMNDLQDHPATPNQQRNLNPDTLQMNE